MRGRGMKNKIEREGVQKKGSIKNGQKMGKGEGNKPTPKKGKEKEKKKRKEKPGEIKGRQ